MVESTSGAHSRLLSFFLMHRWYGADFSITSMRATVLFIHAEGRSAIFGGVSDKLLDEFRDLCDRPVS